MGLKIGNKAHDFSLNNQAEEKKSLKEFQGKWVILYFYPKDNTSGCTMEAIEFTALKEEFEKLDAVILGISPDPPKSHRNFIEKKELGITLLSDPDHKVINAYSAWQKKKNNGREYYGVARSTVLIDPRGKIAYVWPKVKVKGHAEAVKVKLAELQS